MRALALCLLATGPAAAQAMRDWPARPVTLVVPFAAGGASDVLMRVVMQRLGERLGATFVIDNRAGANGKTGMGYLARATPDGYTLGVAATATMANNPAIYRDLPYDAGKDFAPIAMIGTNTTALIINRDLPARNLAEFVALMKSRTRLFSYGSAGVGNTAHLAGELFKRMAGVEMEHVPYRGGSEVVRDIMGGQVQLAFSPLLESMPYVQSGAVRALGVAKPERSPHLPEVPTITEGGVPGIEYSSWQGLVAPAGTPAPIIRLVNQSIAQILAEPETQATLKRLVIDPLVMSPEEFGAFMEAERKRWAEVARAAGVRIE